MLDNYNAINALRDLEEQLDDYTKNLTATELENLRYEIGAIECDQEHYPPSEGLIDPAVLYAYVTSKVARLRLGVYDESREGDLLTVLEEIERILRNG